MKFTKTPRACAAVLLLTPVAAQANIVWPALFLAIRLLSWWAIAIGLVLEFIAIKQLFKLPASRTAVATITANAVSSVVGLLIIPLAGFGWEVGPAFFYNDLLNFETFNPVTWVATFFIASFLNCAIEWLVYKQHYGMRFTGKKFLGLFVANAVSVGIACASFIYYPPSN